MFKVIVALVLGGIFLLSSIFFLIIIIPSLFVKKKKETNEDKIPQISFDQKENNEISHSLNAVH